MTSIHGAAAAASSGQPDQRDHEFLFYARSGERYCDWDVLR